MCNMHKNSRPNLVAGRIFLRAKSGKTAFHSKKNAFHSRKPRFIFFDPTKKIFLQKKFFVLQLATFN